MKSFSQLSLLPDSFGFFGGTGPSPTRPLETVHRCHSHSLLLSSYLCRIKRKDNSRSACGHQLQDLTYLFLHCAASELSGASSLALLLSVLISDFDLGAWPDCWASEEFFRAPNPQKGPSNTTTKRHILNLHHFTAIRIELDAIHNLKFFISRLHLGSKWEEQVCE